MSGEPVQGPRRTRVRTGDRCMRVATDVTLAQHRALKARADAEGQTLASWLFERIGEMVNEAPSSSEEPG